MSNEEDVKLLASMAELGRTNLYYFATELCRFGHNIDPQGARITADQKELLLWLASGQGSPDNSHRMIFTPRDTLKSTCVQAYVLWRLLLNPDLRVLLYGEVHEQAQKRLAVIKRIIEQDVTFRRVYGEWKGEPWNENSCGISTRKNKNVREATIETAGLDVVVNSRHFDLIIPDDIHSEKNSKTKDQIDDIEEKIELLMPLLATGGEMLFAGVFWSDDDAYSRFIRRPNVSVFLRSAYLDDGNPRYPHQLSLKTLEQKKTFMRSDLFNSHYMMDPVPKSTAKFRREWFTEVDNYRSERTFLLIDPAGDPTATVEQKKDSDNFGMVVISTTDTGDIIIRDIVADIMSPTEAIEKAMDLILKYTPFLIGVERTGLGNMQFYLREELRKIGKFAVIIDLSPHGRSKYQRIMELEPYARTRRIFMDKNCRQKEDFYEEITRFPKARRDDIVDPLAYILDVLKDYGMPQNKQEETEPENIIPLDLAGLNPSSQAYWMKVRQAMDGRGKASQMGEFI